MGAGMILKCGVAQSLQFTIVSTARSHRCCTYLLQYPPKGYHTVSWRNQCPETVHSPLRFSVRHFRASRLISLSSAKKDTTTSNDVSRLFRADRVLANRTGQSRNECHKLLKERRVFQVMRERIDESTSSTPPSVQYKVVTGPSDKLSMYAELMIDRTHSVPMPPSIMNVYHKPKWVLSVRSDGSFAEKNSHSPSSSMVRKTLAGILPNMHPVGRLDYDSSGLLLFSSSGTLTQKLLHPKHAIEKEYVVTVVGQVDTEALTRQLKQGVEMKQSKNKRPAHGRTSAVPPFVEQGDEEDDNKDSNASDTNGSTTEEDVVYYSASVLDVTYLTREEALDHVTQVRNNLPPEYNVTKLEASGHLDGLHRVEAEGAVVSRVRLTVTEGKYRMVRRLMAKCGYPVLSLRRERFGMITLGDLPENSVRELTRDELAWANRLIPSTKNKKTGSSKKLPPSKQHKLEAM